MWCRDAVAIIREDRLRHGTAAARIGKLEGHELSLQELVVLLERDGGEEARRAVAELEVVGRLWAVAGLERAAAREQDRLDAGLKELLRRVNAEVAALNTASADCVNAINALRDDTRVAPVVPHTAAEMNADGVVLPWGAATDGDRSGLESFGDGAWDAAVGMWQGAAALVGFNAVTGEGDGELAGQAWFGVGMLVGGIASYAQYGVTPPAGQGTDLAARVQADFYEKSTAQVDAAVLALVASDKWAENPAEAAGATLVNVGSLFLGGGAGAGVKAASIGGRAATIVGHVADFAVPAGSWGVRGATAGLLHAGHGLSVVTDAARLSLVSGVNASRGALAQALHTLADSIPTVRIQPGYSAVTPDGAGFGAVPRLAVGEPGSGGGVLHSVAGRVDVGRAPDTIQIDAPARPVVVDSELGPDTIQFEPPARPAGVEPVSGPAQWQPEVQHPTITHRTIVAGSDVPGVRTPFTERTGLSPNTAYDVEGRGTFYTDDLGRVVVVETDYGPRAALNPDLQKPLANATYIVGGEHVFRTDDLARVSSVDVAHLGLGDAPRSRHVQSTVGSIGGIGFDGGHLVGNATAGGAERINLVAMLREVNRGSGPSYFNLENRWRSILAGDPPPNIAVSIRPLYPEGSPVPSEIRVSYQVDGGEVYRARFANRS